jgi:hypothetical protein
MPLRSLSSVNAMQICGICTTGAVEELNKVQNSDTLKNVLRIVIFSNTSCIYSYICVIVFHIIGFLISVINK